MEITVLGCNGPFPAEGGATSGYLMRAGKTSIAFDMGSGVFAALRKFIRPEEAECVMLSHLHHDHISDMGVYNYYLEALSKGAGKVFKIKCLVPQISDDELSALVSAYPYFDFVRVCTGKEYSVGPLKIEFYQMKHPVLTYGFVAREGERVFAYTADTNACLSFYEMLDRADLILADGMLLRENYSDGAAHLSADIISREALKRGKRAIVTHLSPFNGVSLYKEQVGGGTEIAARFAVYTL